MNSRISQLIARLDSLAWNPPPVIESLKICRGSHGLYIPLPAGLVQALSLEAGNEVELRPGTPCTLAVLQTTPGSCEPVPVAGYQGSSSSGSSSSGSSCVPE